MTISQIVGEIIINERIGDLDRMAKTDFGALNEAFHKLMNEYASRCRSTSVQGRQHTFSIILALEVPEDVSGYQSRQPDPK